MNRTRILKLSIILPLRVLVLELRVARGAAELALGIAEEVAKHASWNGPRPGGGVDVDPSVPMAVPDPEAPAPGGASTPEARAASARRPASSPPRSAATSGRSRARKPPAATTSTEIPDGGEDQPRPRPRRAARKATAARPARKRSSAPSRAQVDQAREAEREAEEAADTVASAGPSAHAGPEVHLAPPWEGYDEMALDEVLARLADADETTLAVVRLYESRGESRQAILLATETP